MLPPYPFLRPLICDIFNMLLLLLPKSSSAYWRVFSNLSRSVMSLSAKLFSFKWVRLCYAYFIFMMGKLPSSRFYSPEMTAEPMNFSPLCGLWFRLDELPLIITPSRDVPVLKPCTAVCPNPTSALWLVWLYYLILSTLATCISS